MTDTIVIGAGLAGLAAAIRLADQGQSVVLMSYGVGGLQLGQGTIDVLGYDPEPVADPFAALPAWVKAHPEHPYSAFDANEVRRNVEWLATLLPDLLIAGDGVNHRVPTALGAMRPTYLIQPSMVVPDVKSIAIVGPRQLKDFYPSLCAENLAQTADRSFTGYHIDMSARPGEVDSTPTNYAICLDSPDFVTLFARAVSEAIRDEEAVGLPAILGRTTMAYAELARIIGRPVFEILLSPPGIPGMRINEAMTRIAKEKGVRVILGSRVVGAEVDGSRIAGVSLRQAGYDKSYRADNIVYAPGGFESGALRMDSHGTVTETLFDLPLVGTDSPNLVTGDYWSDQALFAVGVAVDPSMRPVRPNGDVVYSNLYTIGGILSGAIRWSEKSGDGIAVTSAMRASNAILGKE